MSFHITFFIEIDNLSNSSEAFLEDLRTLISDEKFEEAYGNTLVCIIFRELEFKHS